MPELFWVYFHFGCHTPEQPSRRRPLSVQVWDHYLPLVKACWRSLSLGSSNLLIFDRGASSMHKDWPSIEKFFLFEDARQLGVRVPAHAGPMSNAYCGKFLASASLRLQHSNIFLGGLLSRHTWNPRQRHASSALVAKG